jgi:NAD(P)-dependent dehydrogenase (short-subunit alcohol dehydrogenase family)
MTHNGLEGQIVLVIGGSSGIGYEIARQAIELRARVIIAARNRSALALVVLC